MDIGFTEEQELLCETARRFLENQCGTQFVRQRMAEPAAISDEFWQKLAKQGWLGIVYPEDDGGSGLGHQAADMLVALENARSLTYYAAWAVDQELDEAPLAVSMAKAAASDMYRKVADTGIQLRGGIGMTWEHDLQLYFKRAKASEVAFGDATWHRERVAQLMRL
jgi:alkylation response protein AidB-like acyl-CoA dehydrogenase